MKIPNTQNKTGVLIGCSNSELANEETAIVMPVFIVLIGFARLNVIWR